MNLYHVHFSTFHDVAIFANNSKQIGFLVEEYLQDIFAKGIEYWVSGPVDFSYISKLESYQLRVALAKNTPGYGVYNIATGWKIVPLSQHPLMPETVSDFSSRSTLAAY